MDRKVCYAVAVITMIYDCIIKLIIEISYHKGQYYFNISCFYTIS